MRIRRSWKDEAMKLEKIEDILERLKEMHEDDLIEIEATRVVVKESSRMFVRNVCMAFDLHLAQNLPEGRIFSMTI